MNLNEKPFIVIWEVTQACDLTCVHCRAMAEPRRHALELSTEEGKRLIDQVAAIGVPVFVLTGGDSLKRPDIFYLVQYATERGVRTSMTPSATPLLARAEIAELKYRGLARMALSLDGSTGEIHDAFRGVAGSFDRTLEAARWARELNLPLQINTTITRRNLDDFDAIAGIVVRALGCAGPARSIDHAGVAPSAFLRGFSRHRLPSRICRRVVFPLRTGFKERRPVVAPTDIPPTPPASLLLDAAIHPFQSALPQNVFENKHLSSFRRG